MPGCKDLPILMLPARMKVEDLVWCSVHGQSLPHAIAEHDYKSFIEALQRQGITGEPVLSDGRELPEHRRCCVPGCEADCVVAYSFDPHKEPGLAWACGSHQNALRHVAKQLNGERWFAS